MSWQDILKKDSDNRELMIKQLQAMLRMTVGKHGKESKEVLELGKKFMAKNPTENEIDEMMEYFEELEDKSKPRTDMDELRENQRRSKSKLNSMRDN
jgi:hypothetical protein